MFVWPLLAEVCLENDLVCVGVTHEGDNAPHVNTAESAHFSVIVLFSGEEMISSQLVCVN